MSIDNRRFDVHPFARTRDSSGQIELLFVPLQSARDRRLKSRIHTRETFIYLSIFLLSLSPLSLSLFSVSLSIYSSVGMSVHLAICNRGCVFADTVPGPGSLRSTEYRKCQREYYAGVIYKLLPSVCREGLLRRIIRGRNNYKAHTWARRAFLRLIIAVNA